MDARVLARAIAFTHKLERSPLYRYFSQSPDGPIDRRFLSLPTIKSNLLERSYSTAEDWVTDLSSYFHSITESETSSPIEKHAARALVETILSKAHFLENKVSIETWKADWCEAYQEVSKLIGSAPSGLRITAHARPMQLIGLDVEVSEAEVRQMKDVINGRLTPEKQMQLARLVGVLEPGGVIEANDEVVFDLARLQKPTLLAIRTFLRNHAPSDRGPVRLFDV